MTVSYAPQADKRSKATSLAGSFSGPMLTRALVDAFVKLDPRKLTGNPVIFATWIVALLATASAAAEIASGGDFRGIVLQAINLAISALLYYPFFKAWERILVAREEAAAQQEENRSTVQAEMRIRATAKKVTL